MATETHVRPTRSQREIARLVQEAARFGEADGYAGKRREKRYAGGMHLEVTLDTENPDVRWDAVMHNVCESGISFWTKRHIGVGNVIYVREFSPDDAAIWLEAKVRHKTRTLHGYLIGALFAEADPLR